MCRQLDFLEVGFIPGQKNRQEKKRMFFMASPSLKNVNRAMKDAHKTNSIVRYSSLRFETNIWPGAWVIKRGSGANGIIIMSAWCAMLTISVCFFIVPVAFGGIAYFFSRSEIDINWPDNSSLYYRGYSNLFGIEAPFGQDNILLRQASQWDDAACLPRPIHLIWLFSTAPVTNSQTIPHVLGNVC